MNRLMRAGGTALSILTVLMACTPASPRPAPQPARPTLSGAPATRAEQEQAAALYARARAAYRQGQLNAAWTAADSVVAHYPATPSAAPALLLSARIAQGQGRLAEAARRAARYTALFPEHSSQAATGRALEADVRNALATARSTAPVLGAILPRTGSPYLQRYGNLILQGIQLAVDAEADSVPGVRLLVDDDGGEPENDGARMRDLEDRGALAIVGPLLSAGLQAAATARTDSALCLVSPTATDTMPGLPNTYTLSGHDLGGAQALARYAVDAGLLSVAVLYPRTADYAAEARAFSQALQSAGGQVIASVPYDSGATTFGDWIQPIVADSPQAIYVPAPERDIRQIAPQLRYYGLDTLATRVLGNDAWTSAGSRRVLSDAGLNGVVATTTLPRSSPAVGWQDFVQRYEAKYRRTLDNPYPALGYDAALLALHAMQGGGDVGVVSRRLAYTQGLVGATGVISVVDGRIRRRPFIVRIERGVLQPVDTGLRLQPGGGKVP